MMLYTFDGGYAAAFKNYILKSLNILIYLSESLTIHEPPEE